MPHDVFVPVTKTYTWGSYYPFGAQRQGTRVDATGRVVGFWRTGIAPQQLSWLTATGAVSAIEQRVQKTDLDTGNRYYWLDGYVGPTGAVFPLKTVKALLHFDDGRVYDITNVNIDRDLNGQAGGVPYALFDCVDGYRVKVWFTQHDTAGFPTILNYWEQHYSLENVLNPKWGAGPTTLQCVVQRQAAWQILFDDRYAENLTCSVPGAWALGAADAGGQVALQAFRIGGKIVNIIAPTGNNTQLPWMSASAPGKGVGWVADTGQSVTYLAAVS